VGGKLEVLPTTEQIPVDRRLQTLAVTAPSASPTRVIIDTVPNTDTTSTTSNDPE
jgi:hypothetical protein